MKKLFLLMALLVLKPCFAQVDSQDKKFPMFDKAYFYLTPFETLDIEMPTLYVKDALIESCSPTDLTVDNGIVREIVAKFNKTNSVKIGKVHASIINIKFLATGFCNVFNYITTPSEIKLSNLNGMSVSINRLTDESGSSDYYLFVGSRSYRLEGVDEFNNFDLKLE